MKVPVAPQSAVHAAHFTANSLHFDNSTGAVTCETDLIWLANKTFDEREKTFVGNTFFKAEILIVIMTSKSWMEDYAPRRKNVQQKEFSV